MFFRDNPRCFLLLNHQRSMDQPLPKILSLDSVYDITLDFQS